MSGGSYEYLAFKDASNIFDSDMQEQMERMADDLAKLGYANEAAKATRDLLESIRDYEREMNDKLLSLHNVWHAMEWWQSGDWGEDAIKRDAARYANNLQP